MAKRVSASSRRRELKPIGDNHSECTKDRKHSAEDATTLPHLAPDEILRSDKKTRGATPAPSSERALLSFNQAWSGLKRPIIDDLLDLRRGSFTSSGCGLGSVLKKADGMVTTKNIDVVAPQQRRSRFRPGAWLPAARWCLSFAIAIVLWELTARVFIHNQLFLTPLSSVVIRTGELWSTGELQRHLYVSFVEFIGGFALSIVVGIVLGVILAEFSLVRGLVDPWISMLYATPIIALGPLFILWLGIGVTSKIAIVFLVAVFPILINTVTGLTTTDKTIIEVARSFRATQKQIYTKVRMPAALPFIIAGLRLSVARALVGVVVAEMFGARAGLGFLILNSAQSFDTAGVFVGVIILAIAGVVSVELLKWLEAKLAPWRSLGDEE